MSIIIIYFVFFFTYLFLIMYPYLVFDILVLVGNDGILTDCPWLLMVLTEQFCPTTGAGNTDFSRRKTVLRIPEVVNFLS